MTTVLVLLMLLVATVAQAQVPPTGPTGLPLGPAQPGIVQPPNLSSTTSSVTASPDVTVTGTLTNMNDAVSVALSGRQGAGVVLVNAVLTGTIAPEVSYDSGTHWSSTYFYDPTTPGAVVNSLAFVASSATAIRALLVPGGATNVRVRLAAVTGGTSAVTLTATAIPSTIYPTNLGRPGDGVQTAALIAGNGGGNSIAVPYAASVNSAPAAADIALSVRPYPAGGSFVTFGGSTFGLPPVSPLSLGGTPFTLRATATSNMTPPVVTQTQPPQPVMTFSGKIPGATVNNYVLDAVTVKILGPAAVASTIFARVVRRHIMYASTQTAAPAAGAAPTVANLAYNAAGNAGGTYQYECVGVDIWGYEGNYTANSLTASPGANQGVTVTCPALGAGAAGQNVYGTKTGAAGTLYFLGRTNGTTFQDITPDSAKTLAKSTIGAWGTTPAIETLTTPVELVMEKFVALGTAPTIVSTTTFPGRLDNNRTVTIAPGTAVGRYRIPGQNEAKAFLTTPTITTALARDVDANYTYGATTQTDAAFGDIAVNSFNSSNATMAGTFVVWGHDLIGVTDAVNTLSNNAGANQLAGFTEGSTLTMKWVAPPVFAAADEIAVEIGASATAAATLLEVQISGRYF